MGLFDTNLFSTMSKMHAAKVALEREQKIKQQREALAQQQKETQEKAAKESQEKAKREQSEKLKALETQQQQINNAEAAVVGQAPLNALAVVLNNEQLKTILLQSETHLMAKALAIETPSEAVISLLLEHQIFYTNWSKDFDEDDNPEIARLLNEAEHPSSASLRL